MVTIIPETHRATKLDYNLRKTTLTNQIEHKLSIICGIYNFIIPQYKVSYLNGHFHKYYIYWYI